MSPKRTVAPEIPGPAEVHEPLTAAERDRLRQKFKSSLLETIEKLVIVDINPLVPDKVLETLGALHRLREDLRKEPVLSIRIDPEHGIVVSNGKYQFII